MRIVSFCLEVGFASDLRILLFRLLSCFVCVAKPQPPNPCATNLTTVNDHKCSLVAIRTSPPLWSEGTLIFRVAVMEGVRVRG